MTEGAELSFYELLTFKDKLESYPFSKPLAARTEEAYETTVVEALQNDDFPHNGNHIDVVIPGFLYIGSATCARDAAVLAKYDISAVVSMAPSWSDYDREVWETSSINLYRMSIMDTLGDSVIAENRACLQLLEQDLYKGDLANNTPKLSINDIGKPLFKSEQRNADRSIFVHCKQGISRSAQFVVFFLMYRFYLQLPINATAHEVPNASQIIDKLVLNCRAICPNFTFRVQLGILQEFLAAILACNPFASRCNNITEQRKCEFFTVCKYLELYLETGARCMGETLAGLSKYIIDGIHTLLDMAASKSVYTVWSMKESPFRTTWPWLKLGVLTESYIVYSHQMPSFCGLDYLKSDEDFESAEWLLRRKLVDARYGEASNQVTRFGIPYYRAALGMDDEGDWSRRSIRAEGPIKNSIIVGPAAVDNCLIKYDIIDCVTGDFKKFEPKLPPMLFLSLDTNQRRKVMIYALGFHNLPSDFGNWWNADELYWFAIKQCTATVKSLNDLRIQHGLRSWVMWLMSKLSNNLSLIADILEKVLKSRSKRKKRTKRVIGSFEDSTAASAADLQPYPTSKRFVGSNNFEKNNIDSES